MMLSANYVADLCISLWCCLLILQCLNESERLFSFFSDPVQLKDRITPHVKPWLLGMQDCETRCMKRCMMVAV